jgi:hypothetical protein
VRSTGEIIPKGDDMIMPAEHLEMPPGTFWIGGMVSKNCNFALLEKLTDEPGNP